MIKIKIEVNIKMSRLVKVWQIGNMHYSQALKVQQHLAALHLSQKCNNTLDTLLILEHPPVYTVGMRSKEYTLEEENRLKDTGADFYRTNRGGLITFHGPGQLIVYPILNLKNYKASIKWYVNQIEKTVVNLCQKMGLEAVTSPDTGVWIGNDKVCAIGLHGSRFITTHGLALNCNVDMSWFSHIVPCGLKNKGVTSLSQQLNRNVTIEEIIPSFIDCFCDIFKCSYIDLPKNEVDCIEKYYRI